MNTASTELPLISILINNFNYARYVGEAIESALAQDYTRVEVVVVDDGSTDDSRDVIAAFGNRVRAVFQANAGQASAFNTGFAACEGNVICLLDADDRFRVSKASIVANAYVAHPRAQWVFHPLALFGDVTSGGHAPESAVDAVIDARSDIRRGRLRLTLPATSGLTFHRSLLAQLLPMPEEIRITSDNYLKFSALGISPGMLMGAVAAEQRIHATNAYTLNAKADSLRAEIAMRTAFHLRINFPEIARFAHGVFAQGASQWLFTSPRAPGGRRIAARYVRDLDPLAMAEVVARSSLSVVRRVASL